VNILDKYPVLKNTVIFKDANAQSISVYINDNSCCLRKYSAGEEICSPKNTDHRIGIILDGTATISSADGTKNVLIRTVSRGAVFGISGIYSEQESFPSLISAKNECSVLFISRLAFCSLIENDISAMKALVSYLGNRILYLNKKIHSFTAGSAERRLSLFLADNESDGVYCADVSMVALADMLDIGRASLYRAFDKLEAEGFIQKKEKTILLKNKEGMLEKYFS